MTKKIAKLVQSPIDNSFIVDLKPKEVGMLTGAMNGCCSIIVMWGGDLEDTGKYENVRGHHAGGGPDNLDWDSLLDNVPSGKETRIVMSCNKNDYDRYTESVKEALRDRNFRAKRDFLPYSNAFVKRNGKSEQVKGTEARRKIEKKYTIRNKDKRARL